eukprot:5349625-Pleurochrysis_carterae.AAC.1
MGACSDLHEALSPQATLERAHGRTAGAHGLSAWGRRPRPPQQRKRGDAGFQKAGKHARREQNEFRLKQHSEHHDKHRQYRCARPLMGMAAVTAMNALAMHSLATCHPRTNPDWRQAGACRAESTHIVPSLVVGQRLLVRVQPEWVARWRDAFAVNVLTQVPVVHHDIASPPSQP